ncbi:putative Ig domain-containing protein [Anseongella ginsenosidimutans]|uniref:Putative Ig domain-containing protein n=2 Tax=Anseongella ginsenosidimutans TaxID=496056 RepID=A0A4R3KNM9_9SPHI|nr:putative Ig domain-containing protein [Anseongella ginsenosidimutans]
MYKMLDNCGLSIANYDATLIGWAGQNNLPNGVSFGAAGLSYCLGSIARQTLIDIYGWTINGDGEAAGCPGIHADANNVFYVDSAAAPGGDGSSWATAVNQLSDALTAAAQFHSVNPDILYQIWVTEGTYYPQYAPANTTSTGNPVTDRDKTFFLPHQTNIIGGFKGTETSPDQRTPVTGKGTVLSGDIGVKGDASDNVYHVAMTLDDGSGSTRGGILGYMTITGGNANGTGSITVNGFQVKQNQGGGLYARGLDFSIYNCLLTANYAADKGGGVMNVYGPTSIFGRTFVVSSTLANNNAGNLGDDIFNYQLQNSMSIVSSILADGINYTGTTDPADIQYSLVKGKPADAAKHNLDGNANPHFKNEAAGDYRLAGNSPSINAGFLDGLDPSTLTDLAGYPRVYDYNNGGIIDMGAYEFQGNPVRPDAGGILYVDIAAAPGGDGSSWAKALPQLSDALHFARGNAAIWESGSLRIYVAKGTYFPEYRAHDNRKAINDRNNAFVMVKNVQLYGGFDPAAGAGTMDTRNWAANPTVLSGDIGTLNNIADNAHHVVISAGDVGSALLNGFIITRGNATGSGTIAVNGQTVEVIAGGGIYNLASDPVLTNLIISGNTAGSGGGMYNIGSSPHLTNAAISGNSAGTNGGGIRNFNGSDPVLTNVTIAGNTTAGSGGGMANNASSPSVNNSILYGNTAATGNNIINAVGSTIAFRYSLLEGSSWDSNWGTDDGNNIIATTSPFADADTRNYRLTVASPAVNAGNNTLYTNAGGNIADDNDLAGQHRVYNQASSGIIDMGAYEYQGTPVTPGTGNILYVNQNVSGGNGSGDSWANAIPELADALKWARQQHNADNNWLQNDSLRIFIAKGTYKPLYNAEDGAYTTDGSRDNAFVLVKNVQLYGGFPDTGNPGIGDRDWNANPTILSGDIGTPDDNSDNTYHVVISCGYVDNAGLNGLTISGGNANGENYILINQNVFDQNSGGGMFNQSSSPTILNIMISNNSAEYGGGMYNFISAHPTILNTFISNNSAEHGGGMYNYQSSPTIVSTIISNNSAQAGGGGVYNYNSSPTILNTTISNNSAEDLVGGVANFQSSLVVNNSIVFGNRLADATVSNIFNENGGFSTAVFKYSLVGGATSWNTDWGTDGGNNIITTSNPFTDAANGDFSLKPGAAAINGGSNTLYTDAGGNLANNKDLAGNARVYDLTNGGIVDMGAYEFQGNPLRPDANGILYVDSAAAPGGDGSSWATALKNLSDALKWARQQHDADNNWLQNDPLRIFIAKGTYKPLYNAEDGAYTTDGSRDNAFVMVKNVQLYGGFPDTGNPGFDDRDWNANPTILSGDIGAADNNSDNTYHVVLSAGDVGNALINGFTITGGNATGSGTITVNGQTVQVIAGGGIYNLASAPALTNLIISGNTAGSGGGMYNISSSPHLTNAAISGNSAGTNGGGIRNFNGSDPVLTNVTIAGNTTAGSGGGMANNASSPSVNNSILYGNTAATGNNIINTTGSANTFRYSLMEGNNSWDSDWGTDGGGNIITNASPFADAANGDFSLASNSPAINTGDNSVNSATTDLANNPRIFGAAIDMGAYEDQRPVVIHPDANGIIYVDSAAAPGGDGSSWATALASFDIALASAEAINAAAAGSPADSVRQIWVAKGTYQPSNGIPFLIKTALEIYGGFAGTEQSLSDRNLSAGNKSILKGNDGSVVGNMNSTGLVVFDGFEVTGGNVSAGSVGGIGNSAGKMIISNCIVSNNFAGLQAGGIGNDAGDLTVINSVIINNTAEYGGGIYNNFFGKLTVINCVFANNTAQYGGAVYIDEPLFTIPSISNSILWGNTTTADNNHVTGYAGAKPIVTYSIVEGGYTGTGNLDIDPQFADPAARNYRLRITSPGVNTGLNDSIPAWNSTDLAGNPRIYDEIGGGTVDMGAYEYQGMPVTPGTGNILYVNQSVSGGNGSGDSWANAIPELADALKWARQQHDADNNWLLNDSLRIFIAKGTYKPLYSAEDGGYTADGGRDNAFVMVKNVKLYGGFPDTGNPGISDRDWDANPTILSGDIGTADDNSDNTYHVVVSGGDVGNACLNGLVISGGNANGAFSITVNGLGSSRRDGGGILNSSSSPAILNTSISNNSANYGGGIGNLYSSSSPTILNTSISNNSALNGGGMYNLGSSPTILNTTISNNSANYGGGMGNSNSSPTILNTTISNNSAEYDGGGMYNDSSSPVVNNSIVFGNKLADASVSDILNENASTPVFKYSLVGGAASWNADWGTDRRNNIVTTSNPFADTANADFSLKPGAAAINGGNNTLYTDAGGDLDNDTDLAGNARVYDLAGGGIVDMGAYEYQGTPVTPGTGNILYVNQNVSGGNGSGDSWANAIPELADALKWARQQHDADGNWLQNDSLRIFIAKGTYMPLYSAADGSYTADGGRDNAFVMVKNVKLYGGFPDTGNPGLSDRDWDANPTILNGDIGTADDNSDNSYHVVISAGDVGNAGPNGLIISGGNADGENRIKVNGLLTLRRYGGGMINLNSSPTILNTSISNNSAGNIGGGMYNINSSPIILNTTISNNSTQVSAGGMYNLNSSPTILNTIISNNSAQTGGGGIENNVTSFPIIVNTIISNNVTQTGGGGMQNNGGTPAVINSIVFGNTLADASVSNISNNFSTPVFKYSLIGGATSWNTDWGTDGGNNIVTTSNPFADTANADFRLVPGPAVDGGSNTLYTDAGGDLADDTDLAGNARVYDLTGGGIVDMGAYEYQGACPDILIAEQPLERTVCFGTETSFSLEATGGDLTYQWQFSSDGGTTFTDLEENTVYSGVATATLTIAAAASETAGLYRCLISNECSTLESDAAALGVTLVEITGTPPAGTVDVAYNFTFSVSGRSEPYTWSVSQGELPDWLELNTETGEISGIPESAGDVTFTLQAEDASGCAATLAVNLTIASGEAPVITFPEMEAVVYGAADFAPGASASGNNEVEYVSSNENVAVITSEGLIRIIGAGTTDITASLPEDPNYEDAVPVTRELLVNPAALTITANNDSKTFDGTPYSGGGGITIIGWQYDDTDALLTGTVSYSGDSQGAISVGTYEIIPEGFDPLNNYTFDYQPGILTIIPAGNVVINFPELEDVVYGAADFNPSASSSDSRQVEYASSNPDVAVITSEGFLQIIGAGTTEITASLPEDPNYDDATPVTHELVVNPATLTITANDDSKTYDGTAYTGGNGATVTGWQYDDTDALLEGTLSYSGSSQSAVDAGVYEIIPSGYEPLENYLFEYRPGTLTITPAGQAAITFSELEQVVYGAPDFDAGAISSDGREVGYTSSNENVAVITSDDLIRIIGAGTTEITASLSEDPNYEDAAPVTRELVVNPATLTVTAADDSRTYDGTAYNGGNGVTITGWQYEDTDALLGGTLGYSGNSQGAAAVGQYEIIPAGYTPLNNYTFNYQPGTLTIIPAGQVVINFPQPDPMIYGDPDFDPDATSSDGRQIEYTSSDENVAIITINGLVQIVGAGTTNITAILPEDQNYEDVMPVSRELVVSPAPLTVTADDDSKTYDGLAYSGGNGVTVAGWQYEDTDALLEGMVSYNGSSQGAIDAGAYEIIPSGYELLDNYTLNYQPGTLTIIPAGNVVINFPELEDVIYGFADFAPGASASNDSEVEYTSSDENVAVITSAGEIQIIGAGTTEITASLAIDPNYENADPVTRVLVVNPATLTVIANDDSKTYDGAPYSGGNGVTTTGWQYEDTDALLEGTLSYSGSSQGATDVGIYEIIPSGYEALGNYTFSYQPGTLTTTPAEKAVITFPAPEAVVYGAPDFDPAATSSDGRQVEYASSNENVALVTAGGFIQIVGAGEIEITAFLPDDPNYENVPPVIQELTIKPAMLTITAVDDSKTYDGAAYSGGNGVTVTGWQYDDTDALLEGTLNYTGNSQGAVNTGEYLIVPGGYSADNYEIVYKSGALRVSKAPLVITAVNKTRKFGWENPVFTFNYQGFVSGENEDDLAALPTAVTTANETSPPGIYPITTSGAASENYQISYVNGTLTVIPATRSLVFEALPEKTYGDADFDPGAEARPEETILYSSSNTGVAEIINGMVHITGAGTAVITATLAENPNYDNRPSISRELIVHKASQTIDFVLPGEVERDAGIIALQISASSGLPVTLSSSDDQVAIVAGGAGENQLEILRLGTSFITAVQPGNANYLPAEPVSRQLLVVDPAGNLIKVHQVVSPNSDGINEFLLVEGIRDYPENKMTIVTRSGAKVFEIQGYDNGSRVFKGIANTRVNYEFLPQGTYFYLLEFKAGGQWKRKTGWFVMKFSTN